MRFCLCLALWAASLQCGGARADDAAAEKVDLAVPFITLNIASVDRAQSDIAWMFGSIQRSDMNDLVNGLIAKHADNLKGYSRALPLGWVLFLDTAALPPRPKLVAYTPIENVSDALQTIATPLELTVRPVVGRTDKFEFVGRRDGDGVVMVTRIIGSYAFTTDSDAEDILDILPNVEPLAQSLANRYDAALTVQIKAIPRDVRQVFVNFLNTQAEIDLQRRDEEPEEQYLVRRANGLSVLQSIEQIALQGEDFTIGWNAEPEKHSGYLDFVMNATPDSEFAQYLSAVASKPSMFGPLADSASPLTGIVSWVMNKREQEATTGLLKAVKVALDKNLPELAQPGGPIEQMHNAFQATCDAGHLDGFLQFQAADVGEFVLLGGLKLSGAQSFGKGLEQFLQGVVLKIEADRGTNSEARTPTIVINSDVHQGVSFHKIIPNDADDEGRRLFGGEPDIYLGVSSRALWFAIGCDAALPAIKSSIDTLLTTPPAERSAAGNVPFSLTARVAPWLEIQPPEEPPARPAPADPENLTPEDWQHRRATRRAREAREFRELGGQAFTKTDGLRIEGRPLESGFRTRIHLDEGFVRLLGLIISREYDESQL